MHPLNTATQPLVVVIDDETTILSPREHAPSPIAEATPLARQLARIRLDLLAAMAADHIAHCPRIRSFPDEEASARAFEASCLDYLVSSANARLASPPTDAPKEPASWGWSTEHDLRLKRFLRRAAPQLTEAALCRALARQLLSRIGAPGPDEGPADASLLNIRMAGLKHTLGFRVPEHCVLARDAATGAVHVHGDAFQLGRALWREARSTRGAPEPDVVTADLPGEPSRQLRVEGGEWVSTTGPGRTETTVSLADLARADQAGGLCHRLSDDARERIALTVIEASEIDELMDFPASRISSPAMAAALLARLDDDAMTRWMARQALTERPDIALRVATSCVHAWRHGLVAGNVSQLGKQVVLESLTSVPRNWLDDRSLAWACGLGDEDRVRAVVVGVLGGIGKGLTADEALSILWRAEDHFPLAADSRSRCTDAFLDAIAPALRDGRLSPDQVTRLLGGGTAGEEGYGLTLVFRNGFCDAAGQFLDRLRALQGPQGLSADQLGRILTGAAAGRPSRSTPFSQRTAKLASPTALTRWYAEVLDLWRQGRIDGEHATQLMLGLDTQGWSAWNLALRRQSSEPDPTALLALVDAWVLAIQENLLPRTSLRDGLLSRSPITRQSELARAASNADIDPLSALFRRLGELKRLGVLPDADLVEMLDATVDVDGLTRAVAAEYSRLDAEGQAARRRVAAQRQLTSFERLLNECLVAERLDGASAARLLMARPDGRDSRSVRAAAMAGGHSDSHLRLLDDAVRRGDLSDAQRADAVRAAGGVVLADPPVAIAA
ncbi:hypothetical protein ABE85_03785 [Mitsuaria sp. 7]|nr:hypothetical protein ABE85_03785 [Mitsuaria sp. 7]